MYEDDRTEKQKRANREVAEMAKDAFALNPGGSLKSQVTASLSALCAAVLSEDDDGTLLEFFNQHLAKSGWQLTRIRH